MSLPPHQLGLHLQPPLHQTSPPFLFGAFASASTSADAPLLPMPPSNPYPLSFVDVLGSDGWEEPARKRSRGNENSQISSLDLLQTGSVSTGLGLSLLDDRRLAGSSSADSPLFPLFGDEIGREMLRQDAEMDRFLKVQGERLKQAILEKIQAKQFQTLASVEEKILRKLREKETEVEIVNRRNSELEEQMKQLGVEVDAWQNHARYNENMIAALRFNLQQVLAQGRDSREGCGDSEVDDTASCCNREAVVLQSALKEAKGKEPMACKVCRAKEVRMLLLPCRHLCLCKDCENKISECPVCQSSKLVGIEIYM